MPKTLLSSVSFFSEATSEDTSPYLAFATSTA